MSIDEFMNAAILKAQGFKVYYCTSTYAGNSFWDKEAIDISMVSLNRLISDENGSRNPRFLCEDDEEFKEFRIRDY